MKHAAAGVGLLSVILGAIWTLHLGLRPSPAGAVNVPPFAVGTGAGPTIYRPGDYAGGSLVVLYHSACRHCLAQLDAMERAADDLEGLHLFFLTPEADVPVTLVAGRWPRLARAPRVTWGRLEPAVARYVFGLVATPSMYRVDARGVVVRRWVGVTEVDALLGDVVAPGNGACGVNGIAGGDTTGLPRCEVGARVTPTGRNP